MMMALSPLHTQRLVALAKAAELASYGGKESLYQQACAELGMARATLLKHLKTVAPKAPRKQRCDAGDIELSLEEALLISAYCMEGYRKNDKKIIFVNDAVSILRQNKHIIAGRVNAKTGEMTPFSESTIHRALRRYVLHPEQLRQATPHTPQQSRHPNDVFQVDASVCVLYYLPNGKSAIVELDKAEHYKNKPENIKAIEKLRVIRYVLTDHFSGLVRFKYYPHAESGEHTVRFLAWAIAPKPNKDQDPFHGAPNIVEVDPGATASGLVALFCQRMSIRLLVNKSRNPRAKGSVERANDLIETNFESKLRFLAKRPASFDELNALAERFQLHFNMTKIHTRTQQTRFAVWLTITAEQLRTTPSEDILLSLVTEKSKECTVRGDLTVQYKTRFWNVEAVPNVFIGDKLAVHWHPFIANSAMAVVIGEDGHETYIALPEITQNQGGFLDIAAYIGDDYKQRPDTIADTNRKLVHRIAAGTETLKATEKKRASKGYVPFDGQINPFAEIDSYQMPSFMAKRGTELPMNMPNVELLRMNAVQMAKWMMGRLGEDWQPSMTMLLKQQFPNGATEPELEQVLVALKTGKPTGKQHLTIVGG